MAHVYHWKHGWIPLTHTAAMQKAKGNKALASQYVKDAPHAKGITSRREVAHAALDLPNVPAADRPAARDELHAAATRLGATDLLPGQGLRSVKPTSKVDAADVRKGDVLHVPSLIGGDTKRYHVDHAHPMQSDGIVNVDVTDQHTGRSVALSLEPHKQHTVEREPAKASRATRDQYGVLVGGNGPTTTSAAGLPNGYLITNDRFGLALKYRGKIIRTSSTRENLVAFAHEHKGH